MTGHLVVGAQLVEHRASDACIRIGLKARLDSRIVSRDGFEETFGTGADQVTDVHIGRQPSG